LWGIVQPPIYQPPFREFDMTPQEFAKFLHNYADNHSMVGNMIRGAMRRYSEENDVVDPDVKNPQWIIDLVNELDRFEK
jgi:hypothetical protein